VTDTMNSKVMRKELCRSVRPPYVDIDNVHYVSDSNDIGHNQKENHNLFLLSRKSQIDLIFHSAIEKKAIVSCCRSSIR
jgi:hypothetical protein